MSLLWLAGAATCYVAYKLIGNGNKKKEEEETEEEEDDEEEEDEDGIEEEDFVIVDETFEDLREYVLAKHSFPPPLLHSFLLVPFPHFLFILCSFPVHHPPSSTCVYSFSSLSPPSAFLTLPSPFCSLCSTLQIYPYIFLFLSYVSIYC